MKFNISGIFPVCCGSRSPSLNEILALHVLEKIILSSSWPNSPSISSPRDSRLKETHITLVPHRMIFPFCHHFAEFFFKKKLKHCSWKRVALKSHCPWLCRHLKSQAERWVHRWARGFDGQLWLLRWGKPPEVGLPHARPFFFDLGLGFQLCTRKNYSRSIPLVISFPKQDPQPSTALVPLIDSPDRLGVDRVGWTVWIIP
jgi:hypothetical protein